MPTTAGLVSAGIGVLGGGLQALFSGKRKAESALENQANSYTPDKGILDYYSEAKNRAAQNPLMSAAYQSRLNNNLRTAQTQLDAGSDRRAGLSTIGAVGQNLNDANANAVAQAENMGNQNFNQLGHATQMNAAENAKKFDMIYNLKALKAGAANAQNAQGLSNMFNGLSGAAQIYGAKAGATSSSGATEKHPVTMGNTAAMRYNGGGGGLGSGVTPDIPSAWNGLNYNPNMYGIGI